MSRNSIHLVPMQKFLAVLAVAGLLAAQDLPVTSDSTIKVTFKFVVVPVTVTDRNGDTVNGLTPMDFRLFDNGKLQRITEDVATHPVSLVVVVQANGEMEKLLPMVNKIGNVINQHVTGETGEVAVIGFDHRIQKLTGFTSDPDQVVAAFKKLKTGSWTATLNDAVMEGVNMLKSRPPERRRVILIISENRDKGSGIHPREVLSAIEFANIGVYSVDISKWEAKMSSKAEAPRPSAIPPEGRPIQNGVIQTQTTDSQTNTGNWTPIFTEIFKAGKGVFVPSPLKVYTEYTGGREYSFLDQRGLDKAVAAIGGELHSQYMLLYRPNNEDDAGFHHIIVEVQKAGLNVRARDGYYQAGQPPSN
jgi:VWFA-related protein